MKGKGKERKNSKKCVSWPGFEPWSQPFTAKKHLTVGLHSNYSGRSPRPSGRSTPSFLKYCCFDVLMVRTVDCTVITVRNRYDGVIAQPRS
jgi:hypothetical protein